MKNYAGFLALFMAIGLPSLSNSTEEKSFVVCSSDKADASLTLEWSGLNVLRDEERITNAQEAIEGVCFEVLDRTLMVLDKKRLRPQLDTPYFEVRRIEAAVSPERHEMSQVFYLPKNSIQLQFHGNVYTSTEVESVEEILTFSFNSTPIQRSLFILPMIANYQENSNRNPSGSVGLSKADQRRIDQHYHGMGSMKPNPSTKKQRLR